jgi:hypothetical protein
MARIGGERIWQRAVKAAVSMGAFCGTAVEVEMAMDLSKRQRDAMNYKNSKVVALQFVHVKIE